MTTSDRDIETAALDLGRAVTRVTSLGLRMLAGRTEARPPEDRGLYPPGYTWDIDSNGWEGWNHTATGCNLHGASWDGDEAIADAWRDHDRRNEPKGASSPDDRSKMPPGYEPTMDPNGWSRQIARGLGAARRHAHWNATAAIQDAWRDHDSRKSETEDRSEMPPGYEWKVGEDFPEEGWQHTETGEDAHNSMWDDPRAIADAWRDSDERGPAR